jgi:hypothetical protein
MRDNNMYKKPAKYVYKSFRVPEKTQEELKEVSRIYGECPSAVIRRLITEAYTFLMAHPELKNYKKEELI